MRGLTDLAAGLGHPNGESVAIEGLALPVNGKIDHKLPLWQDDGLQREEERAVSVRIVIDSSERCPSEPPFTGRTLEFQMPPRLLWRSGVRRVYSSETTACPEKSHNGMAKPLPGHRRA